MINLFRNRNILFLLLANVGYIPFGHAQTTTKKLTAIVDVIIEDTTLLHGTTVEFDINQNNINTDFAGFTTAYTNQISEKKTRFVIPLSTTVNYGRIQLNNDALPDYLKSKLPLNDDNNLFIFEAGDTVELHLLNKAKGAYFVGKYADKYNCIYQIGNANEVSSFSNSNALFKVKNYTAALTCKKDQCDSLYKIQSKILDEYHGKLDTKVENLIKLDCWGTYNRRVIEVYFNSSFIVGKQVLYRASKDLFMRDYGDYRERFFSDTASLYNSFKYVQFLTIREKAFAVITRSSDETNYYNDLSFGDIFKAINMHYIKGKLKDEVTLFAFLNIDRRRQTDFANYVQESINNATANQFRDALINFKNANELGSKAFAFKLPDKDGQVKKLADFKGKLIVIDFWFTGCRGCLEMAKVLKPIITKYKSNPNIVFISVSIDKTEDIWRKSLAQERYSSKDEVNLLTKLGMQSNIIKHYNISTFPTLLIISKEGNTISNAPPDPRINTQIFIDFINQYKI